MAALLFIHGAWHGGWCWEPLANLLRAQGHIVAAPDMPGTGGLADYTACALEALRALPEPPILVGHSQGGLVITAVAEQAPNEIRGLVYVCAFLPRPGQSISGILRENNVKMPLPFVNVSDDRLWTSVKPGAMEEYIYHDCPRDSLLRAQSAVRPEPAALSKDSIDTTAARFGRLPRAYIECLRDRVIPLPVQRAMHAATPCRPVLSMDTGHAPFCSDPSTLAAVLQRAMAEMPLPSTH